MWDESEKNVNSNIFTLDITKCQDGGSRGKRSVSLTPSAPYTVDRLPAKPLTEPQFVNATSVDRYGMIYHTINVSVPLKGVIATITPLSKNTTLQVFVNINSIPTPDRYLLRTVVSTANTTYSNATLSDEDHNESLYNTYISVDLLQNHTNQSYPENFIQIGVRNLDPGKD